MDSKQFQMLMDSLTAIIQNQLVIISNQYNSIPNYDQQMRCESGGVMAEDVASWRGDQ